MSRGEERPLRRYRSRSHAVSVAIPGIAFFIVMVAGLASDYLALRIFVALSLLVMGVVGVRLFRSGIEVFDRGIRVRNVLATFELPWARIDRFEIGSWGLIPTICLIHLEDGGKKHVLGIQERTNFPSGSAEAMAEELNAELARRT